MPHICDAERAHHKLDKLPPTNVFKFCVEDRIECSASGQVQYKTRNEYFLPFNIPLAAAVNLKVRKVQCGESESKGQGWGFESAWIRIHFWSWIWIRNLNADPDPRVKNGKFQRKTIFVLFLSLFISIKSNNDISQQ